jgi:hypothetical protein
VNVGQGGYGIDQAYLWYRRDAADLERSAYVLAFIGDDFLRMQSNQLSGPCEAGPGTGRRAPGGAQRSSSAPRPRGAPAAQNGRLFNELRSVRLLGSLVARVSGDASRGGGGGERTWQVAEALFDALAAENAAQGSKLVLVFLPTPWDYDTDLYRPWRERVRTYADRTETPFLDLVEELRALPATDARSLFIPDGQIGAPHLDEKGNAWVARQLHERLRNALSTGVTVP